MNPQTCPVCGRATDEYGVCVVCGYVVPEPTEPMLSEIDEWLLCHDLKGVYHAG